MKLAIIGTHGLITESLLAVIAEHPTLSGELVLLGDEESEGETVDFGHQTLHVANVMHCDFSEIDILVCSHESQQADEWLDQALDAGCVILDVGGHQVTDGDVPMVVAGVNEDLLEEVTRGSLVVLPDAATVQCATLLKPLMDAVGLERASLFSCHAVSEMGRAGVEEMARQSAQLLNGKSARPLLFPRQVAFNLVPHAGDTGKAGAAEQEGAIAERVSRILADPSLPITVSCCWAPVFFGHTQLLHFTTAQETDLVTLKRIFAQIPYVNLLGESYDFPTAVTDASGKDQLTVGRMMATSKNSTDFSLWGVADNLRYGIAGNAVKIIEVLVKRLFISYS